MKYTENYLGEIAERVKEWIQVRQFQITVFNILLMLLILLRSAGYFAPYFPITINSIFLAMLLLSVFILGTRSASLGLVAFFFWTLAAILRILEINVWAERAALYAFEALALCVLLLVLETIFSKKKL